MGGKEITKQFININPNIIAKITSACTDIPKIITFRNYGFKAAMILLKRKSLKK